MVLKHEANIHCNKIDFLPNVDDAMYHAIFFNTGDSRFEISSSILKMT